MKRLIIAAIAALWSSVASAQGPCEDWTQLNTIVTTAHVTELRECMNHLHDVWHRLPVSTCRDHWKREGQGEDTFDIPPCVKRIRITVERLNGHENPTFRIRAWNPEDKEWWTMKERLILSGGYRGYLRTYGATDIAVLSWNGIIKWKIESVSSE